MIWNVAYPPGITRKIPMKKNCSQPLCPVKHQSNETIRDIKDVINDFENIGLKPKTIQKIAKHCFDYRTLINNLYQLNLLFYLLLHHLSHLHA